MSKGLLRLRQILAAGFFTVILGSMAVAQVPTSGNVFFGYSYYNTNISGINSSNTNGWEASFEGKVFPFVGIVADFSQNYGSENFPILCPVEPVVSSEGSCTVNANIHEQNYLFGPRVSASVGKFRPFAEALFGAGHVSTDAFLFGSSTSFATALGGGLDYRIIRPIAWRVQGDYVQTRFFGNTQNNVRISTGIVLRF
jgi:hypothetical protein